MSPDARAKLLEELRAWPAGKHDALAAHVVADMLLRAANEIEELSRKPWQRMTRLDWFLLVALVGAYLVLIARSL